jgi:hypothetical protein
MDSHSLARRRDQPTTVQAWRACLVAQPGDADTVARCWMTVAARQVDLNKREGRVGVSGQTDWHKWTPVICSEAEWCDHRLRGLLLTRDLGWLFFCRDSVAAPERLSCADMWYASRSVPTTTLSRSGLVAD